MWIECADGKLLNPCAIGIRGRANNDWTIYGRVDGIEWEIYHGDKIDVQAIYAAIRGAIVDGLRLYKAAERPVIQAKDLIS